MTGAWTDSPGVSGGAMFCVGIEFWAQKLLGQPTVLIIYPGGSDWVRSTKVNLLIKILIQHLHFQSTLWLLMSCSSKWVWEEGHHLHPHVQLRTETGDGKWLTGGRTASSLRRRLAWTLESLRMMGGFPKRVHWSWVLFKCE